MTAITTIAGSDVIANSRTVINTNFSNLNSDKIETSVIDTDTTLSANSDAKIPSQKAVKAYVDAGGNQNATATTKGIVEIATQAEADAGTVLGATGASLVVTPDKISSRYPTFFNLLALGNDSGQNAVWYVDTPNQFISFLSGTTFTYMDLTNGYFASAAITTAWAAADNIQGVCALGLYVYVLMRDVGPAPDELRLYRYLKSDLTTVTQMTFSGATVLTNATFDMKMSCDGTNLYFNAEAGNDTTNYHKISKFSISGTVCTFVNTTTCGSTATALSRFQVRTSDSHIIGSSSADNILRRFNTSGTLQASTPALNAYQYFSSIGGVAFYTGTATTGGDFFRITIL